MSEFIGQAAMPIGELEQPDQGVRFRIPYRSLGYDITLGNDDLDTLFDNGLKRSLARKAFFGFGDLEIQLLDGDLPLFIGTYAATIGPPKDGLPEIRTMEARVATMSEVYKYHGRLTTQTSCTGEWSLMSHEEIKLKKLPDDHS